MTLDTLLQQPLAPVRDDGFSVRVILAMRRAEERRRLLLWGAAALALLPPLAFLPLAPGAEIMATRLAAIVRLPLFGYGCGALVLFWAMRPRRLGF